MSSRRHGFIALSAFLLILTMGCGAEVPSGPETAMPVFAESGACGQWACEEYICGYDTATDPRGACCVEPAPQGQPGDPKPVCDEYIYCQIYPSRCTTSMPCNSHVVPPECFTQNPSAPECFNVCSLN